MTVKEQKPKVVLLEHNISTYERLKEKAEGNSCVMVTSCPGSGKSYVTMRFLEEHQEDAIVVCPKRAIANEWDKNAQANGVRVSTMTYQALNNMSEARLGYLAGRYKYIIFDECHHVGAQRWQQNISFLMDQFPDNRFIGLTATPIRYLDGARDVGEEFFDSNIVHGKTQLEAVMDGVLPGFTYVCGVFALAERVEELKKKAEELDESNVLEKINRLEYNAENINEVYDAFDRYMPAGKRKGIVFVDHIHNLGKAVSVMKGYCGDRGLYLAISSAQPWQKNRNAIETFKNASEGWLFAVNMLNEGVHLPGVNTIVMLRKTVSPSVYIQQLGRGQAAGEEKAVVFDFVGNRENLKAIEFLSEPGTGKGTAKMLYKEDPNVIVDFIVTDACRQLWELEYMLNIHKPWTPEEKNILTEHYKNGIDECIKLLPGRTRGSIREQAARLGLTKKRSRNIWVPEEDDILVNHYKDGIGECIRLLPERTKSSITNRAHKLGLMDKTNPWTTEEDDILFKNHNKGVQTCQGLLSGRDGESIRARARILGIKISKECKKWTQEEDDVLIKYYRDNKDACLKLLPDRSKRSIETHASKIGLTKTRNGSDKWTKEEDDILVNHYKDGPNACLRLLPSRTKGSIIKHANQLGLKVEVESINKWTREEDNILTSHYKDGIDVCLQLLSNRTKSSITNRAHKLGLKVDVKNTNKWTKEEEDILATHYEDGIDECIKLLPRRTKSSIVGHASVLGIAKSNKWSPEENAILRENYKKGFDACLELLPGRTRQSITKHAKTLGITKNINEN